MKPRGPDQSPSCKDTDGKPSPCCQLRLHLDGNEGDTQALPSFPQYSLVLEKDGTQSSRDSRFNLGVPLPLLPIPSPRNFPASLETKANFFFKNVSDSVSHLN